MDEQVPKMGQEWHAHPSEQDVSIVGIPAHTTPSEVLRSATAVPQPQHETAKCAAHCGSNHSGRGGAGLGQRKQLFQQLLNGLIWCGAVLSREVLGRSISSVF